MTRVGYIEQILIMTDVEISISKKYVSIKIMADKKST